MCYTVKIILQKNKKTVGNRKIYDRMRIIVDRNTYLQGTR